MMETKIEVPLPQKIKNSIYVHPFINDTDVLPSTLIDKLPLGHSFLRLSSTHSHLTIVTKHQNILPKTTKNTIPVLSEMVGKILFVSIFMKVDTVFPGLTQFSENRNLVLNLVQDIKLEEKMIQENINANEIIEKINQNNLLNNNNFYDKYINKLDRIEFPALSKIRLVKEQTFLLCFENKTYALISKNQLLSAMTFNPALQKNSTLISPIKFNLKIPLSKAESLNTVVQNKTTEPDENEKTSISNSINHTFIPPLNLKKRKEVKDGDLNEKCKRKKPEENNKTENAENKVNIGNYILEDSKSPTL